MCRSYMTLGNETVAMFHYLTVDIKDPFYRPVSGERERERERGREGGREGGKEREREFVCMCV